MPHGKRADGARRNPGVAASRQSAANCNGNSNGGFLPKSDEGGRGAPTNGTCSVGAVRRRWPSARTEPQARRYNRIPNSAGATDSFTEFILGWTMAHPRTAFGAPASGTAGVEFSQKRAGPEIGAPLLPPESGAVCGYNQELAAKGDEYGLLRMAERYCDGDGVEKDLTKAKEYFNKAIAAGSPTAAEELKELNNAVEK